MRHLKHLFVPHLGNNYHPTLLQGKRTFFYALVFITLKAIVVSAVLLVPHEAYLMPDVLAEQARAVYEKTNALRMTSGLPQLGESPRLVNAADAKAFDMIHNNYFSHTGPDNHTLDYFLHKANYAYTVAGENLAMGFTTADAVIDAWENSATHRANLLDPEFQETGVAVELGQYRGEQTVFIVQHFGATAQKSESNLGQASLSSANEIAINVTSGVRPLSLVDYGTPHSPNAQFDRVASKVYWQAGTEAGSTSLLVKAKIYGSVKDARVTIQGYVVPLFRESRSSPWYVGGITAPQPPEAFFKPVVLPAIIIVPTVGKTVRDTVDWYNIHVPEGTPTEQYFAARNFLAPFTEIFVVSQAVYLFFLTVFGLVLFSTIMVRMHKISLRPLLHGMFTIGILFVLWWI